jgi:hypothetical protein
MRQSRGAAAELDGEASHQSDGLAPTSKRRMQRRSRRPADAELTLLELCACPLSHAHGGAGLPKQWQVDRTPHSVGILGWTYGGVTPQMVRLCSRLPDARIAVMAVIERLGKPESRPYVVAWGRLTEEDEGRLLARVLTSRHVDVTVDLCEIEEVTDEGCTAIKNVAGYMGQDQTMVVLYKPDREATRSLERSGIADDGRIVFVASSPSRRISLAL